MQRIIDKIQEHVVGQSIGLDCWHTIESHHPYKIGDEIECSQCDELSFPSGLQAYKKTPVFNQQTVPKGFRRAHSTKKGVWAVITVLSGKVCYIVDDLENILFELDDSTPGIIAPQMLHHLELTREVELYVEFYKK